MKRLALTLLAVSAYLLAGARHDAHVAPAEMMMAPQVTPPSQDAVTTTRESPHPAGDPTPDPPPPTEQPAIPEQPAPGESTHPADPPGNEATRPGEQPPPGESTHSADPPSPRPRPRAEPTGDQVLAELALIQRIKEALDADQPARALTLVEQHARSFARGTLIEEREALGHFQLIIITHDEAFVDQMGLARGRICRVSRDDRSESRPALSAASRAGTRTLRAWP